MDEDPNFAAAYDLRQGEFGDWTKQSIVYPHVVRVLKTLDVSRILDVGCGNGAFCRFAESAGFSADGIDISAGLIERAKSRDGNKRRKYEVVDCENAGASVLSGYDCLVCLFSVQDMRQPSRFFSSVRQSAATGTTLVIMNESYFHLTNALVKHSVKRTLTKTNGFDEASHVSAAEWTPDITGFTYCRADRTYLSLLERSGLKVVDSSSFGKQRGPLAALQLLMQSSRPFIQILARIS